MDNRISNSQTLGVEIIGKVLKFNFVLDKYLNIVIFSIYKSCRSFY